VRAAVKTAGDYVVAHKGEQVMRHGISGFVWAVTLALMLSACGGGNYSGPSLTSGNGSTTGGTTGGSTGTAAGGSGLATPQDFFAARVEPNMSFCRNCHVPGGIADTDKGKRLMLSSNSAEDYAKVNASWVTLGKGVETNRILLKASNTDPEPHSGGSPWPKGSAQYNDMKTLLSCWDSPAGCAALLAGVGAGTVVPPLPPLLGDLKANGGRNYVAVFCEGKADDVALPKDPRELIAGDNLNNKNYSVWYNDAFEICENDTLLKTQARQNAILVSKGQKPVYTAKARPKTCGEWNAAVERGRQYITSNPITGAALTRQSLYKVIAASQGGLLGLGGSFPSDAKVANELIAKVAQQRYGWPESPYRNPFPMPGEDPIATNGGSLQLPITLVQVKDDSGKWTGKLGVTCFACHIGQIGTGEVVGNSAQRDGHKEIYGGSKNGMFYSLNGSNTDAGLALYDIAQATYENPIDPDSFNGNLNTPAYMANRTRGTNAADQEIVNVLFARDLDTLDFRSPLLQPQVLGKLFPSMPLTGGDQDIPTWWWTHNKTRYLWVGFGSAGSSRGNYFPASTNPNDGAWSKHREGDFQDMDMWLNAVEAPKFVGPPVDAKLAEQGAILFHNKNLWAGDGNADIPRPPVGNGSCAGCHGAYSPRFINQPGFLPDPSLAGMSGATVPLNILGTDPAQSWLFTGPEYGGGTAPIGVNTLLGGSNSWFAYPDALEGYRLPEEKTDLEKQTGNPFPSSTPAGNCALGTKGGYTAQPLHGVWASGPYFHNGSVPTVWDVLKPSDRPDVWRRQQVPENEAAATGDRSFDTNLTRAYDYDKLGWKYERLACDARTDAAAALSCNSAQVVPTALDLLLTPLKSVADYFAPPYLISPTEPTVAQRAIYNTHAYSKGNQGHAFTKVLTDQERKALVEYLKTL
jgi:hypothetical protein